MKHYCPTGRRNDGRPLKRLLDTQDRNGSTSGPTPRYMMDDDDDDGLIKTVIPNYAKIKIPYNSPAMTITQRKEQTIRLNKSHTVALTTVRYCCASTE